MARTKKRANAGMTAEAFEELVMAGLEEAEKKWAANRDLPRYYTNSAIRQEAREIMDGNCMVRFGMSDCKEFDQLTDEELEVKVAEYRRACSMGIRF